jgi:hypothetical protein
LWAAFVATEYRKKTQLHFNGRVGFIDSENIRNKMNLAKKSDDSIHFPDQILISGFLGRKFL